MTRRTTAPPTSCSARASGIPAELDLSALNGTNGFKLSGEAIGDRTGLAVSSAGDINGDGFDDMLIGGYRADLHGANSGVSYVVFGSASGFPANFNLSSLNGTNGFQLNGITRGEYSGTSVSTAGDVNGDGFADIIVSGYHADPHGHNSGAAYVVFGSASGFPAELEFSALNGTNGFRISGEVGGDAVQDQDRAGNSVAAAGDVNGDGFDDVIIGAALCRSERRRLRIDLCGVRLRIGLPRQHRSLDSQRQQRLQDQRRRRDGPERLFR